MVNIAGGIILAVLGLLALLVAICFLLSIPSRIQEGMYARAHRRRLKGARIDCPACSGTGQVAQKGGYMTFYIDCPSCLPIRRK